jgi:Transglycosylase SLT domain
MLVDSSNSTAASAVAGAIRQASQATGTSFDYLLATAQVESGLNPQAGAATSSARGLFQFIEKTWLATIKQAGPALGYGRYADAITASGNGQYEVRDPTLRSEILKLRNDPAANAVMAGAFTKANAAALSERLGRSPSEGELYIAHFLGAGGAARLIALAAANPNAKAADFFPNAAQANGSIFYDRASGAARTLAQVRDVLTARYDVARGGSAGQVLTAQAAAPAPAAAPVASAAAPAATAKAKAPDTAGITGAFAAAAPAVLEHKQVFRGLFADPNRSAPLAPVVSALWGVPGAAPPADGATAPPQPPPAARQTANVMFDLFKDPPSQGS